MIHYTSSKAAHRRFDPDSILYLEGNTNYCHVHLITGEVILMAYTLKKYQVRWPFFIRVHKRLLVNPNHIRRLGIANRTRETSYVVMTDQRELRISRRRLSQVQQQLAFSSISSYSAMEACLVG